MYASIRCARLILPASPACALVGLALWFLLPQVETKFGVLGVLLVAPCVGLLFGALNGVIIVAGRLQPFIVTLAMMVTALGVARLTAGQNNAVLPVYTGTERHRRFRHAALAGLRRHSDAGPLLHRRDR